MNQKPVVDYLEIPLTMKPLVGHCAIVFPVNHPNPNGTVSNRRPVRTSVVQNIIDDNTFETQNTIYKKVGIYSGEDRISDGYDF